MIDFSRLLIAWDKANHIAYGGLSGSVGGSIANALVLTVLTDWPLWVPPLAALGSAAFVGWVKDRYIDLVFNWDDFWNTVIGGALPALPLSVPWLIDLLR